MARTPNDPRRLEDAKLGQLERRLGVVERQAQASMSFSDANGVTRTKIGFHESDGKWGLRVWNSSGVLVIDDTA